MEREDPTLPEYRWELSNNYLNLAEVLEKTDRAAEAEQAYREALRLADELLAREEQLTFYPDRSPDESSAPEFRHNLSWGYVYLGRLLHRSGRLTEAESAYKESLAWLDRQTGSRPHPPAETCLRATAMGGLGQIMHSIGRVAEAQDEYREVCEIWKKFLAESPTNRHYLWNYANSQQSLGDFLHETVRGREAAVAYRDALTIWERLADQYPALPVYSRQLAWVLVTTPQAELRNPHRAVELARKAVELAPKAREC